MRKSVTIAWDDLTQPITPALLTTRHPASSYDLPVVVVRRGVTDPTMEARGPADLAGIVVAEDPEAYARAEVAGYRVAASLDEARTRQAASAFGRMGGLAGKGSPARLAAARRASAASPHSGRPRQYAISVREASGAARHLVSRLSTIQWTMDTVAGLLPTGWTLDDSVEDGDLMPLTVANVTSVLRQHVRLAQ